VKYSIIIPFYKVKPFVRACLDSVLSQTVYDWECICVDDGSPDGLGVILDEYANRDARIKVIHQQNAGVSAARNNGLEIAKGDWISFLDGDDVMAPWTLELCENAIKAYPDVDMVRFRWKEFGENEICDWSAGHGDIHFTLHDTEHVVDSVAIGGAFWGRIYRRATMGRYRFRPLIRAQDTLYLTECGFAGNSIAISSEIGFGYRQRSTSTVHTRMTYEKLCVEFPYAEVVHQLMVTTNKKASKAVIRDQFNGLTEGFYINWKNLPFEDEKSKSDAWSRWVSLLLCAAHYDYIPTFQKIRISIFLVMPSRIMASILFGIPHKLKLIGFHR
jgi:glycosyltransferase involved in cell wall biosynthesis